MSTPHQVELAAKRLLAAVPEDKHERTPGASPGLTRRSDEGVDTALIDRAVAQLNRICKQATFDFAMAVGRTVIDIFHSGSLETWRARGPKDVSLRKLAKHTDLPMSPAALYRSVAIYEMSQRLEIARWPHLSTSHMRLVLPLPSEDQARLLKLANANAWSVERLDREIATAASMGLRRKGGHRRQSPMEKTLKALGACIDESDNLVGMQDTEISPEMALAARKLMARLREACRGLEDRLGQLQSAERPKHSIRSRLS